MIELKYFPSNFFKVQMTEKPLAFRRMLLLSSHLPMKAGWADKSGDTWFALYEQEGVLTFRAGEWTCPIDADAVCTLVDGPAGAAVFSVSMPGHPVFTHRYTFAKWKKLAEPGYAQDGRLADDFFAWVADIWKAKAPV